MKYMGSKNRYAKELLPIILEGYKEGMWYIEPFVGGGNMIDKVNFDMRIGCDVNPYVIQALKSIRDDVDSFPKNNLEFTEGDYKLLKHDDSYLFKGYAGFAFSYSGKWLGGWRRDSSGKRDYVKESYNNAVKQSPNLQGVKFLNKSVFDIKHIEGEATIYCDPPYQGATKYKDDFDHSRFWDWVRFQTKKGHNVFVSEYNAPEDFECLWSKEVNNSLTKDTGSKKGIEKLFKMKG
jgi:DNA adenine methylase